MKVESTVRVIADAAATGLFGFVPRSDTNMAALIRRNLETAGRTSETAVHRVHRWLAEAGITASPIADWRLGGRRRAAAETRAPPPYRRQRAHGGDHCRLGGAAQQLRGAGGAASRGAGARCGGEARQPA